MAVALALAGPATAQNRQPISVSMTECHVLLRVVAENASARRTEEEIARMATLSDEFILAAVLQAEAEGRADPEAWVLDHRARLTPGWEAQIANPLKLRDTLDWVQYCRALGRDRGLIE